MGFHLGGKFWMICGSLLKLVTPEIRKLSNRDKPSGKANTRDLFEKCIESAAGAIAGYSL
jgi:hypothetical protein